LFTPLTARRFPVPFVLTIILVFLWLCGTLPAQAQHREFTLEDTYTGAFYGDVPDIQTWLKDSKHYLSFGSDGKGNLGLIRTDAITGNSDLFLDRQRMADALVAVGIEKSLALEIASRPSYTLNRDENRLLLTHSNDLYLYLIPENRALRLTHSPEKVERDATFSPDGKHVAFTRDNDLYVIDLDTPSQEHRLTQDGSNKIRNGVLDWVYEEEVYGRGRTRGFEWSPDSRRLAVLRIDDTPVPLFPIIDQLPRQQNTERWEYPLAGDPNPIVTLIIVTIDGTTAPRPIDVSKYPADNRLLVRFAWLPNAKKVSFQVQPRNGTFLDVNVADVDSGKTTTLFRETTPFWVEILENPFYLQDGSFLWLSDRTGYRHIYHYRADGTLIGPVTKGEWDVRHVHGVDPGEQYVYFDAAEHTAIADNAYRTRLDGTGEMTRLTTEEGNHTVKFSPDFTLFLDAWSSVTTPVETRLHDGTDGKELRVLSRNSDARQALSNYRFSRPELLQIKTHDGFLMEAEIIRPQNFDPQKKYPVWMEVYAGPSTQTVRNEWDWTMWHQLLAQKGYIVWECDNRSASAKGMKSAWTSYKRFGIGELADIEESLKYLKALPYVDASRIGITGWSFGGFMTEFALTHSTSFKCGFAGAGVSDWHLYDSIYTERYMDTPQANPEGYRITSAVEAAANCSGKMLIVHGMMDDNVHLQNSIQLIYALQKAGKDFEMMLYPSPASRHDIADPALSRHLRQLEFDFILKNL
jgi:dipeptidyl-peptidase-4